MKRAFYWLILVFVFSIPISSEVSIKVLILVLIGAVFINRHNTLYELSQWTWDGIGYIAILIFGLIYTKDLTTGIRVLETSFSLVALMVAGGRFYIFDKKIIDRMFISFMSGLFLACIICILNASFIFSQQGDIQVFSYYQLTDIIKLHPTYLAYYLITAITYAIYLIYHQMGEIGSKVLVPITIFFFIILMLTGGRTAYVSLLLVLAYFILKFMLEDVKTQKINAFALVIFLLVGLLWITSLNYFNNELNLNNDYWERSQLWRSAIKANPNPFFGVGTGDYKMVLNDYYLSHNLEEFAKESYNSHNQFIQIYFSNGIIGLIALVIMIGRPLYLSVKSQNTLGILLMFPFVFYGVTEVFLGRYQGVVFFALLHQIVIYQHYSLKSKFSLKAG